MNKYDAISPQLDPEKEQDIETCPASVCNTAQERERLQQLLQIFINIDTRLRKRSHEQ